MKLCVSTIMGQMIDCLPPFNSFDSSSPPATVIVYVPASCREITNIANKPTPLFAHLGDDILLNIHDFIRPFDVAVIGPSSLR